MSYKTKVVAIISLLLLLALGVSIRKEQNYDYSGSVSLTEKDEFTLADFKFLGGYEYTNMKDIPEPGLELDGRRIEISGFMLPADTSKWMVSSFMLLNSRFACCSGVIPKENEFIFAKMADGKTVKYINDKPVTINGEMEITRDNFASGIYSIVVNDFREGSIKWYSL